MVLTKIPGGKPPAFRLEVTGSLPVTFTGQFEAVTAALNSPTDFKLVRIKDGKILMSGCGDYPRQMGLGQIQTQGLLQVHQNPQTPRPTPATPEPSSGA